LIANLITAARIVLTPFIAIAILQGRWNLAFGLGIAAGLTDALDGFAARLLHASSRTGAYLDPIADKLLLSVAYLALGLAGAVPWWMVALVFGRDVFILMMCAYGWFFTPVRDFPPSIPGKLSTILQIVAAVAVVNEKRGGAIPATPFLWLMVAGTIGSGIHYGWRGWTMLRSVRPRY
jgi:cardiolipin synthase